MATKTWSIEIICDHDDSKNEIMLQAVRTKAKELLTLGMLLQDRRAPMIKVESGDHFEATSEVMLVDTEVQAAPDVEAVPTDGARTHNAQTARVAGYTVSDRGSGWKFNDPDGAWSQQSFATEAAAWEGAFSDISCNPKR
jgi:hypothetical protein